MLHPQPGSQISSTSKALKGWFLCSHTADVLVFCWERCFCLWIHELDAAGLGVVVGVGAELGDVFPGLKTGGCRTEGGGLHTSILIQELEMGPQQGDAGC